MRPSIWWSLAFRLQGVLPVLETCAAKRVPFVVILSGGFRESGPEGVQREQSMLAIARKSGMRIIGPNCLGFANIHSNVYAAFGSITREPKLKPGSVSLVTQSGGFGYSIALACSEAGIGFRHVIATGNESDIDTVQLIDALLDDAETRVIVAYIEGTRDGRALLEVARRALCSGQAFACVEGGRDRARRPCGGIAHRQFDGQLRFLSGAVQADRNCRNQEKSRRPSII